MCKKLFFLLTLFILEGTALMRAQDFVITDAAVESAFPIISPEANSTIVVERTEEEVVHAIAQAVANDLHAVTGKRVTVRNICTDGCYPILAGTLGQSEIIDQLAGEGKIDTLSVKGKWEAYGLCVVDNPMEGVEKALVAYGCQARATAYALLEISRKAGVSPWIWWADVAPAKKKELWASGSLLMDDPSVKFRGIFINDEDFGLKPWAAKKMDSDKKNIGPKTYAQVMELLLRLRANTLWPAMHACSAAFWYYKDNLPVAKRYDIYLGSSHCEQMLRDNEWEWNRYGGHYNDDWNWKTNRAMVQRYWAERVGESRGYKGIYTLGMRGVHDTAMNGYGSTTDRVAALTEIIAWQRQLLQDSIGDPTTIPQLFIPYKEVLSCYNAGLKVPDDVILMWVDDNHGYIRQLPNATEQRRSGGNAIYYHLSYWGTPESYLWLSSISPSLCAFELCKAYSQGVRSQWIINVGDIKPAEMELEFCMDLAWDVEAWGPEKAHEYTRYWAAKTFGQEFADEYATIKRAYYRLAAAGKPEHVNMIPYTIEGMDARIAEYEECVKKSDALKARIPASLQDAYYQLMEYPLKAAFEQNRKIFRAYQSLELAKAGQKDKALEYASEARMSYRNIKDLTEYYNKTMAAGKWDGMMSYHPQDRPQFFMPDAATPTHINNVVSEVKKENRYYVSGGAFSSASSTVKIIEGLGVTDSVAVIWPLQLRTYTNALQAPYATYDVPVKAGKNMIEIQCLPTFPVNTSYDLRVGVRIGAAAMTTHSIKTKAMEGTWNQTVSQGYAAAKVDYNSTTDKTIKVRVALIDPGVAISRIVCRPESDEVSDLTCEMIVNYDFEIGSDGKTNTEGTIRGIPYGWQSKGTLNGNSYGINQDAIRYHGRNVCWISSSPMPSDYSLYQTIEAGKLEAGAYKVSCLLWVEKEKLANCRLFANNSVQYYGKESDYTNLLTNGETNTFAGYEGLSNSNMTVRPMEVYVNLNEGEALTFGIKSSNKNNDGTASTNDKVGWFKVDFFQLEKVEGIPTTATEDLTLTRQVLTNYDFEQYATGSTVYENTSGTTRRGVPYGWKINTTFPGTSYGINNDAGNPHGTNVCWFLPKDGFMPNGFELYQTVAAGKLEAGRYLIQCRLWVEDDFLSNTRLFANNSVQYYGMPMDYGKNVDATENATFASYIGGAEGNYTMQDMYLYVDIAEGESLRLGIRSGNLDKDGRPNSQHKNGWFKVDYFRIHKADSPDAIEMLPADTPHPAVFNLQGLRIDTRTKKLPAGIYIQNGRKFFTK